MSDQFTEVSEQGFGSSLMDSIKGVAAGGLLFILSFPVLWWNEGRTDLSEIAKKATIVQPASVDNSASGKLVSLTSELQTDEALADPEFLKPGKYIKLERVAEMYAWVQKEDTKTEKKLGGGKRKETTYTYDKKWTSSPKPPSEFRYPEGHENPGMPVEGSTFGVKKAKLGAYWFNAGEASLPSGTPLRLTKDMISIPTAGDAPAGDAPAGDAPAATEGGGDDDDKAAPAPAPADEAPAPKAKRKRHHGRRIITRPPADRGAAVGAANRRAAALNRVRPTSYKLANETYLFRGLGSLDDPRVGDVRVSFQALQPGGKVTLFGQLGSGGEVSAYTNKDGDRLFRALPGTHPEAVQALATEHKMITWVLRIVGFLMMWIGLCLFFGPINAVLDILPFLGSAGRFLVGLVMLPVSILMSVVVILVSIVAHSPILLVLTLLGLGGGGYFLWQKKKKARAAA